VLSIRKKHLNFGSDFHAFLMAYLQEIKKISIIQLEVKKLIYVKT